MKIHTLDLNFCNVTKNIAAFLVETTEGIVLLETGPHSTFQTLSSEIKKLGFSPDDIAHVFLTHIHLDHAGAAWAFAEKGAKIYVHPRGKKHLADPSRLMESARRIYKDTMDSLWGEMKPIPEAQIYVAGDGEKITIGETTFISWYTPGHAVHHIAWQVEKAIICGDVAGAKIFGEPAVVPPCPPPDIHIEDWKNSIAKLRALQPEVLYLTHFGIEKDIEGHFDKLTAMLDDWAQWIKPYWENGTDPNSMVADFLAYTKNQLINSGVSTAGIEKYNLANPAWMSVFGLMRYWKKKEEREQQAQ